MKPWGAVAAVGAALSLGCAASSLTVHAPAPPAQVVSGCVRDATTPFRCPILMYHRIAAPAANESAARRHLYCPPELFSAQLDALTRDGYQPLTLRDVEQILEGKRCPPERPVVLSFDDGTADHWPAAQELAGRKLRGVFFVVTQWLDDGAHVTRQQLLEMQMLGMEIGSHSRRHVDLRRLSPEEQHSEVFDSKRELEEMLQEAVPAFAYPGGAFDLEAARLVGETGYLFARSTTSGVALLPAGRLAMPAIHIHPETSPAELLRQLEQGPPLPCPICGV